jgi:ribonuclease P protein component
MRRAQRLRHKQDFADVYRRGKPLRGELLIMRAHRTDGPLTRFGFTASTAIGNAVTRNRVRRRLKAAASKMPVAAGWDIVFNSRAPIANASFAQIEEQMRVLLDRAGLLESRPA